MVDAWWRDHGQGGLLENLLPPDGFIVERDGKPLCAAWLYLSAGIGVAFLEWVVARPGLPFAESKAAFIHLIQFLKQHARSCDYGVIWCNTLPGIARVAAQCGFVKLDTGRVSMAMNTLKED